MRKRGRNEVEGERSGVMFALFRCLLEYIIVAKNLVHKIDLSNLNQL